jgi:hypothetical protein
LWQSPMGAKTVNSGLKLPCPAERVRQADVPELPGLYVYLIIGLKEGSRKPRPHALGVLLLLSCRQV